jgi:hypothetical protein
MSNRFLTPEVNSEVFHLLPLDDVDYSPDMATDSDKIEPLRQRVGNIDARLAEVSKSQIEIKNDLGWHRRIGWVLLQSMERLWCK